MKKKIFIWVVAFVMFLCALPSNILSYFAFAEDEEVVSFDSEMWNEQTNSFNKEVVSVLIEILSGSEENGVPQYPVDKIDNMAAITTSYADWMSKYPSALEIGFKAYFTIGGLKWLPMYLSTDKQGNTILTMWLEDAYQEAWSDYADGYKVEEDSSAAFYDGSYYSSYSIDDNYMYSTSKVRTYGLNNASNFVYSGINEDGEPIYQSYVQNENHPFALFTSTNSAFTDYLVTPSQVTWQEYQAPDIIERTTDSDDVVIEELEYFGILNYIYSITNMFSQILGDEAAAVEYNDLITEYCGVLLQYIMTPVNDAWTSDIVNDANQEELNKMVDWYILNLDIQIENAEAAGDTNLVTQLEGEKQQIQYLVEEFLPFVAVDKFGNYYNYSQTGLNYQNEQHNADWKNDYLWLPSVSEVGPKNMGVNSIWDVENYLLTNGNITNNDTLPYTYNTLVRSACAGGAIAILEDSTDIAFDQNEKMHAIRPAFHLNLTKIIKELGLNETGSRYVIVDEIWNEESQEFNLENLSTLYSYISGSEKADINTLTNLITLSENGMYNASDIRNVAVGNKGEGKDVIVKIGGYDWHVTCLSNSKNSEPVLTLWLANSVQAKNSYNKKLFFSLEAAYIKGSIISMSIDDFYASSPLRAFALNNTSSLDLGVFFEGSKIELDENGMYNYSASANHPFALFTSSEFGFTQYLTTPRQISWQEHQNAYQILNGFSSFSNDAWSLDITNNTNGYSFTQATNYAELENYKNTYDDWADDYLWLPSAGEIYSEEYTNSATGQTNSFTGLWGLSVNQIKNYDGSNLTTKLFVEDMSVPTNYLLRSGTNINDTKGLISVCSDATNFSIGETMGFIRPAMHLNLSLLPSVSTEGLNLKSSRTTYNGSSKLNNIGFVYDGVSLTPNADYTFTCYLNGVEVTDIVDAGSYKIVFNGLGDYIDYQNIEFTYIVDALNISSQTTIDVIDIPQFAEGETTEIIPTLNVYYNSTLLEENVHYLLSFSNNTSPTAKATYTITFIGNYKGTIKGNFLIAGINLNKIGVTSALQNTSYYCDMATVHKYPLGNIYAEGVLLKENIDYIWYYLNDSDVEDKTNNIPDENFIEPGAVIIIIEGIGNYTGVTYVVYSIEQIDISRLTVSINQTEFEYNGSYQKPTITAKFGDKLLIEGTDYTLSYSNNLSAGTSASVDVDFRGDYAGRTTFYFTINPRDISNATIQGGIPEYTYTGDITPFFFNYTLLDGERTISYSDYEYSPKYKVEGGTYNVVYTGKNNYTGTKTITVVIKPAKLAKIEMYSNMSNTPDDYSMYYNQGSLTDRNAGDVMIAYFIELEDGTITHDATSYFTSLEGKYKAYRNGVETTDLASVGEITFKFFNVGTRNFYQPEGEYYEQIFTIVPDPITSAQLTSGQSNIVFYNRSERKVYLTVASKYTETLNTSDYTISYYKKQSDGTYSTTPLTSMCDAGEYKWVVTSNSKNYTTTKEFSGTFKIIQKPISSLYKEYYYVDEQGNYLNELGEIVSEKVLVAENSANYSGLMLEVDVYFDSSKTYQLVEGVDYTVVKDDSLLNSEDKYSVTITAVENSNYAGSYATDFYINLYRLDLMKSTCTKQYSYNLGSAVEVDSEDLVIYNKDKGVNLVYDQDYIYYTGYVTIGSQSVYVDRYTNNINTGTATVYIQGKGSYIGIISINFEIIPLNILDEKVAGEFALEAEEFYYRKKAIKPTVTHQTLSLGTDFSVIYTNNINVGTAIVNIFGEGNFDGLTTLSFEIKTKSINDSDIYFSPEIKESYNYYNSQYAIANQIKLKYDLTSIGESIIDLKSPEDYKLTFYRNGEETNNQSDVGTVNVVLEGKNGFEGTITFDFVITPKSITGSGISHNLSKIYNYKPGEVVQLKLYDSISLLVEGVDYQVVFKRNGVETYNLISAGIIGYEITGINNYENKIIGSFEIEKGTIIKFTQDKYEYTYNREVQKPVPIDVYDKKDDVILNDEYELIYYLYNTEKELYEEIPSTQMDFITPGQYKIVAQVNEAKNNYQGSCEAIYIINKKSLADIIGSSELENLFKDQEFTNSDIKQDIELNFGDYGLVEGEDYKVSYENNKDTGKVEVKIEGLGNYAGSLDTSFEIISKPMDEIVLDGGIGVSDLVIVKEYTGENVSLEDSDFFELIPYGDGYLVPGVDFTYTHKEQERIEMGNYKVTLSGIGNYMNSVDITMQIAAISFDTHLETDSIQSQIFTGYEITPQLTFYIDGTQTSLTLNTDYKIKYVNNINAGNATVIVEGIGYYSGSYQTTFQIVPAQLEQNENFIFNYTPEYTYSAQPVSLDLLATYQSSQDVKAVNLIYNTDFTVSVYRDNNKNKTYEEGVDELFTDSVVNAHSYLVKLQGKDNYSGAVYLPLTINKLNVSDAIQSGQIVVSGIEQSYVYTGSAINPVVAIIFKDKDISQTDFVISYDENINVLTGGLVVIETKETSNFTGLLVKNFAIEKATLVVEVGLSYSNAILYGGDKLPKIIVLNELGVEGELAFENPNKKLEIGSKEYNWVFTPTDTNNYNIVTGSIEITAIEKTSFPWAIIVLGAVALGGVITLIIILVKKSKKKKDEEEVDTTKLKQLSKMKEQDVKSKQNKNN